LKSNKNYNQIIFIYLFIKKKEILMELEKKEKRN